ncbi:MAG: DNA polymerase III subunit gamma/tau [Blastocatellales bacterium]
MNHQVIARKYRPQTFADLTGQEHITRTLRSSLDSGRLHHAYLFSGVRGTGKTTTARILAKGLNCSRGMTGDPCLECPSCLEIAAGNSIDVIEIDAASNTGVENVRDVIINNIAVAPARDRFKVFIIDEVHMLSGHAFNALLKTLEEPPSHVVFIMATTELHKVPDTILSRCQQFEFKQIPADKIFQRLREIADQEKVTISDQALREIARAGAGSLRDAQSAFDQIISFSGSEISEEDVVTGLGLVSATTLGEIADAIAAEDSSRLLGLVGELSSRGHDLRNFSRELMSYFRHLLLVKTGIDDSDLIGVAESEMARLKSLASKFGEEDLVRCFHLMAATEKEIKDSPHPRFQLEIGLVRLAHLPRLRPLTELIRRIEELESRIAGGATSGTGRGTGSGSGGGTGGGTAPASGMPRNVPTAGNGGSAASASRPAETKRAFDEPPDFPEPDLSEPDYIDDYVPGKGPARPAPPAHRPPVEKPHVPEGLEVEAILNELQKRNRGLVLTALEDAQKLEFRDNTLHATYGAEDMFVRRIRESGTLFRELGESLFGRPILIEVTISGQVEQRVDEAVAKRQQLIDRAGSNPAVKLILEQTRGDIVSVKERS